jgi:DNA-binding transcriptional ArsR family regulator
VIDRLREQIQERPDQLAGEADRLRKALAALDPRSSTAPARKPPVRKPAQQTASKPTVSATNSAPARQTSQPAPRSPHRTAPGATKASVLTALADGEAMTAGQVADKTGLARGTVSTTLSKLVKSGEVHKAERGQRLAQPVLTPLIQGKTTRLEPHQLELICFWALKTTLMLDRCNDAQRQNAPESEFREVYEKQSVLASTHVWIGKCDVSRGSWFQSRTVELDTGDKQSPDTRQPCA